VKITTDIRAARRMVYNSHVPHMKVSARRRHRRWARMLCHTAERVGDADFHRRPFLTDYDVA